MFCSSSVSSALPVVSYLRGTMDALFHFKYLSLRDFHVATAQLLTNPDSLHNLRKPRLPSPANPFAALLLTTSRGQHAASATPQLHPHINSKAQHPAHMTVNGHSIPFKPGQTILQAAADAGLQIPSICHHPRLPRSPGTCRVCLVNVDGRMKPSCVTEAQAGQVVETDSEEVREHVRGQLALLRTNHPDDCMACDVNGRCEFQRLITQYQVPLMPKTPRIQQHVHAQEAKGLADFNAYVKANPLGLDTPPDYPPAQAATPAAGAAEGGHSMPGLVSHGAAIAVDQDKCIKCGRCVTMCQDVQQMNVLGWIGRGQAAHVGVVDDGELSQSRCIECGQCVSVCPVGALTEHSEWRQVLQLLRSGRKVMVVQTAPAVRVAIGEEAGLAPGSISTGQLVTALRQLGFHHVFDVDFAADLTIMEEGTELLQRLQHHWEHPDFAPNRTPPHQDPLSKPAAAPTEAGHHTPGPLPMFTSCCPAWINEVERDRPELIPHLSSCKSPQGMMGSVVKAIWAKKMGLNPEDVVLVSIMPCTAKKHEARREELLPEAGGGPAATTNVYASTGSGPDQAECQQPPRDVDFVLTTRELGTMLRQVGIPLASLEEGEYDHPLAGGTGAAVLFGATGGVMEAALRTVAAVVGGAPLPRLEMEGIRGMAGVKEATLTLKGAGVPGGAKVVRVAVASGIAAAQELLDRVQSGQAQYDFIEVMSCPGGCIGGGGQPKTKDPSAIAQRMAATYTIDQFAAVRQSHENPDVQQLYKDDLGAPGSHEAHKLLHTHYTDRTSEVTKQ